MVRGALNELSWSLLDCTCAPRKALMRLAAMVQRHSDALGADHRRIFQAIEDHANPPPTNGVPRALEYPCFTRLGWGELACVHAYAPYEQRQERCRKLRTSTPYEGVLGANRPYSRIHLVTNHITLH
jgi:hypothetical protein